VNSNHPNIKVRHPKLVVRSKKTSRCIHNSNLITSRSYNMSLPEPFVVTNRKKKCRQCGDTRNSLTKQAHNCILRNNHGTEFVCRNCRTSCKKVTLLISISRMFPIFCCETHHTSTILLLSSTTYLRTNAHKL
jgi:hypothetical protein